MWPALSVDRGLLLRSRGVLSLGERFAWANVGVWPRRCTIMAAMAALVLLPIKGSNAGWRSDAIKGSPKQGKSARHDKSPKHVSSAKHAASPNPRAAKLAAL